MIPAIKNFQSQITTQKVILDEISELKNNVSLV